MARIILVILGIAVLIGLGVWLLSLKEPLLSIQIGVSYSSDMQNYCPPEGRLITTGRVQRHTWQFDDQYNIWTGILERFSTQVIQSASESVEGFTTVGFLPDGSKKRYSAEVTPYQPSRNQKGIPGYVMLENVPQAPGELLFWQEISGNDMMKTRYFPLQAEHFELDYVKPASIKFQQECRFREEKRSPCITLDFTGVAPFQPQFPEWVVADKPTLGLEFIDKDGIRQATALWEYPYAPRVFPEQIENYNYASSLIRVLTPQGYAQYGGTIPGKISLENFPQSLTASQVVPPMTKITVSSEMFERMGGSSEALSVTIINEQNTILFAGLLKNVEFVPGSHFYVQLSTEEGYRFDITRFDTQDGVIYVKPAAKLFEVAVKLTKQSDDLEAGSFRFMAFDQEQKFELVGKDYRGQIEFPCIYRGEQFGFQPVELIIYAKLQGQEVISPPIRLDPYQEMEKGVIRVTMPEKFDFVLPGTPSPDVPIPTPTDVPPTPTAAPEPDLPTPTLALSPSPEPPMLSIECLHYGLGPRGDGFYYDDALALEENGWHLPSYDEFEAFETFGGSCKNISEEILRNEPYWAAETTATGKPFAYCFGDQGNCRYGKYEVRSPDDAFAILLIRKVSP